MTDRPDPRFYALTPSANPGMAVAHQLGLPYLTTDRHGRTTIHRINTQSNEGAKP